jgi:hypothetical protein
MARETALLQNRDRGALIRAARAGRREQHTDGKCESQAHWFDIYITSFETPTNSCILWE